MRLLAYNAPAKKSIEISLPWHSSTIPIADLNHDIVRGKFNKSLKPQNPDFFGGSGYYVHNTQGYLAKPDSLVVPSGAPLLSARRRINPFFMYQGTLKTLACEWIFPQGQRRSRPLNY